METKNFDKMLRGIPFVSMSENEMTFALKHFAEHPTYSFYGRVSLSKVLDDWPNGLHEVATEVSYQPWCRSEHLAALIELARHRHDEAERAKTSR